MKVYKDVELTFIENTHKYLVSYLVGEKWLEPKPTTGVTTYCNALSKDFLAPWAAKLAAEYVLAEKGKQTDAITLDEAKKQFKQAADSGARAGKLGHAYVEAMLKDKKVTMPTSADDVKVVNSVAQAYEKFMEDWTPEILEVEKVLYSKTHNFAGTADFVVKVGKKLVIGDWKTTNTSRYNPDGIYATYFAQLGGYCLAYEEMTGKEVDELWVVNLPKDGSEYKLRRLEDIEMTKTDCIAYFLALKQAYEINQKMEWAIKR